MYKNISSSLIISTYNWPAALELCLLSVKNQTIYPDEVIIADDGSAQETSALIKRYQENFPVRLVHVWHEDNGFRLATIRNKAIAKAQGDYIIQVDGDIIMHNKFIQDHLDFAKPASFVRASRIYINESVSQTLIAQKKTDIKYYSSGVTNRLSGMHVPFLWKVFEKKYKSNEPYEIHGCNMAFWKKDAIAVNGYNENFNGWGPEDKEFVVRLLNIGLAKRFIKLGAVAFHVWHKENTKPNLLKNEEEFHTAINEKRKFCTNGIDKHL
jgi:glycosyltransferase involved in cell wall biosynthesis